MGGPIRYESAASGLELYESLFTESLYGFSHRCAADTKLLRQLSCLAFENLLKEAKRRGEVEPALDERVAAKFLLTTIRGLRVSAKAGVSPDDLRGIATLALSSLKPRGAA